MYGDKTTTQDDLDVMAITAVDDTDKAQWDDRHKSESFYVGKLKEPFKTDITKPWQRVCGKDKVRGTTYQRAVEEGVWEG
jgi:hypothetical protein